MNVAVLDLELAGVEPELRSAPRALGPQSDWIDPEGDDWLAAIYRELTRGGIEPAALASGIVPEPEHWFG
jgi:hypothetical protein